MWAQNQCDIQSHHDDTMDQIDERTAVFIKSLNKVYTRFPLWNSSNTLLIDDSQEKIPTRDACNFLHPPPMNGKQSSEKLSQYGIMSDAENHDRQMNFFASLVGQLESRGADDQVNREFSISALLNDDLASMGHMKWKMG